MFVWVFIDYSNRYLLIIPRDTQVCSEIPYSLDYARRSLLCIMVINLYQNEIFSTTGDEKL